MKADYKDVVVGFWKDFYSGECFLKFSSRKNKELDFRINLGRYNTGTEEMSEDNLKEYRENREKLTQWSKNLIQNVSTIIVNAGIPPCKDCECDDGEDEEDSEDE